LTKRIGLILWLGGWLLAGCILPSASTKTNNEKAELMQYLALGDSYTIGEGVAAEERWPVQLVARLRQAGIAIDDPMIIARTGWTTDELIAGIERQQPEGRFDLVSLLIGVNNQFRGREDAEYREQFRSLLQSAIALAGGNTNHVLVLSIPDWGVTPFARGRNRTEIASAIDRFNAINQAESTLAGVHYVDITPISRQAAADVTLLAEDELHPSGKMYAQWVAFVLPTVKAALGEGQQ
jgi:lysophospholipase L1-like esterase